MIDSIINLLYNLLPQGRAWTRDPDSDLYKFISSIAVEYLRMDDRLEDLIREIDPFHTNELLIDFETMLGLPEQCYNDIELSDDDRRRLVIQKFNALGGASAEYFETLLANSGIYVDITPYFKPFVAGTRAGNLLTNPQRYFRAGSRAGDRLYNTGWTYWFEVRLVDDIISRFSAGDRCGEPLSVFGNLDSYYSTHFRAGDRAGDRLQVFGNQRIECIIKKLKPAHTNALFTYGA